MLLPTVHSDSTGHAVILPARTLTLLVQSPTLMTSFNLNYLHMAPSPWRRQWHPLQSSCLENPMDGGAWWATIHGVATSLTRWSGFTFFLSIVPFGEGNGNPFQCSCLENPMDGGAWWATVYGVAESRTLTKQLTHTHTHTHTHTEPSPNTVTSGVRVYSVHSRWSSDVSWFALNNLPLLLCSFFLLYLNL